MSCNAKRGWLFAFLLALGLAAPGAQAHARLVRSSPHDKAELGKAPTQIELWFNELLEENFNLVELFLAADLKARPRPNLASGNPKLDPRDRTHLQVQTKSLAPGDYILEWRVLSRDGHSAPGRLAFKVLPPK